MTALPAFRDGLMQAVRSALPDTVVFGHPLPELDRPAPEAVSLEEIGDDLEFRTFGTSVPTGEELTARLQVTVFRNEPRASATAEDGMGRSLQINEALIAALADDTTLSGVVGRTLIRRSRVLPARTENGWLFITTLDVEASRP